MIILFGWPSPDVGFTLLGVGFAPRIQSEAGAIGRARERDRLSNRMDGRHPPLSLSRRAMTRRLGASVILAIIQAKGGQRG